MRYSYVDGIKAEAKPKLVGVCPCCGGVTIAKCGRFTIHHWAHKNKLECDPWWENESEWHRSWKKYFPEEWQEVIFENPVTKEKHIADIFTENKCVIEVQSYPISEEEAKSREDFYGNMVWIINGCKSDADKYYFNLGLGDNPSEDPSVRKISWFGRGKLLARWCTSSKPVYFDFGGDYVWQLIKFDPKEKEGQVKFHSKNELIKYLGGTYT